MKILTPEQQAKLRKAGFGMWGGRKGRCHGGGCGAGRLRLGWRRGAAFKPPLNVK